MNASAIRSFLICFVTLIFLTAAFYGQGVSPAKKAYQVWKEKRLTTAQLADGDHIGIAFAVTGSNDIATINIAVGVGSKVSNLGEMKFTVQPMTMTKGVDGKNVYDAIGNAGTLRFSQVENTRGSEGDVVAEPRFTMPLTPGASAVKIFVKDKYSEYSVLLPLTGSTNTAVLVGKIDTETELLGKCVWISGDCGSGCEGRTFCRQCNAGGNLDCGNCALTCLNNGDCTGAGPVPPYWS